MRTGYWDNISSWLIDFDVKDRLFRIFFRNGDEDAECDYVYLVQWINLGNDILIGVQFADDSYPNNRYPSLDYYLLSEIQLCYFAGDDEDEDEDEI